MGWLPTSILPSEARFAYVASPFRLAEIYVPFVLPTSARGELPPIYFGHIPRGVSDQRAQDLSASLRSPDASNGTSIRPESAHFDEGCPGHDGPGIAGGGSRIVAARPQGKKRSKDC